jgi:hypothetical protein
MAEDIIVTFGASTQGLTDGLADARAQTKAAADDMRASVAQVGAAFGALGKDQLAATMAQLSGDMALARQELSEKMKLLAEEVKAHQISESDKRAATAAALQDEYTAERNALDGELQMDGLRLARKQEITERMLELDQRYQASVADLEQQAVVESAQRWDAMFGTVEGAFNSQLHGLLSGTTSWSRAVKNILEDLIIHFIEAAEKMTLQWVAGELAQTSATAAGVAARASATQAGAATGLVANFAAMVKSIAGSAAETFAGIFGFLAPVMGPAAVGPAAAGEATVASVASAVPSFAIGSWSVPADTLAMVHAGETIIPAGPAAAFRAAMSGSGANPSHAGGSGDTHVHFAVSAIDQSGVRGFFRNNSKDILRAINHGVATGSHLGLSKIGG